MTTAQTAVLAHSTEQCVGRTSRVQTVPGTAITMALLVLTTGKCVCVEGGGMREGAGRQVAPAHQGTVSSAQTQRILRYVQLSCTPHCCSFLHAVQGRVQLFI
jgi:hypothetical protein